MNIDRVFAALASRPRRMILAYLSETSLTAGEIAERFDMSKPALSKHLKLLETAGLVNSEKKGQYVHYRLSEDNLPVKLHSLLATFCPIGGPLKRESKAVAIAKSAATAEDKSKAAPHEKTKASATVKNNEPLTIESKKAPIKANSKAPLKPSSKALPKAEPKAAISDTGGEQALRQSGNKLQLELAIGAPLLPPTDH